MHLKKYAKISEVARRSKVKPCPDSYSLCGATLISNTVVFSVVICKQNRAPSDVVSWEKRIHFLLFLWRPSDKSRLHDQVVPNVTRFDYSRFFQVTFSRNSWSTGILRWRRLTPILEHLKTDKIQTKYIVLKGIHYV